MSEELVVALGDARLVERDMRLLVPGGWLNDQLIAYYFEHLARNIAADALLLEPSLSHMAAILQDSDTLCEMLSVPSTRGATSIADQMRACPLVITPINDKSDPDEIEGGCHWSLLVFRRWAGMGQGSGSGKFEHYDSCKGVNAPHARAVARCLLPLLQPGVGGVTIQLVAMQTPQQATPSQTVLVATSHLGPRGSSSSPMYHARHTD
jgi:hypothetical protein